MVHFKVARRVSVFLMFLIGIPSMMAQEKFVATYFNSYFNEEFDIRAKDFKNKNSEVVYIEIKGEYTDEAYIEVWARNLDKFRNSLELVRDKFIEWENVAIENNVQNMSKKFDIKFPLIGVYWYTSKWWSNYGIGIRMTFEILPSGKAIAKWMPKIKASSNQFVDQQFYLVFQNEEDFNALIELLDLQKIVAKMQKTKEEEDLFK